MWRVFGLWVLSGVWLWAQQEQNAAVYRVSGVVVNTVTGEPVPRALVDVNVPVERKRADGITEFNAKRLAVMTDGSGQFSLEGVPAGRYAIGVRKPGYITEWEYRARPQQQTEVGPGAAGSVRVVLVPQGVIAGHVTDVRGHGLAGIMVQVQTSVISEGKRTWQQAGVANSDEDGEFRVSSLKPGDYLVRFGPMAQEGLFERPEMETGMPVEYWPNARTATAAGVVSVRPGETFEADVALREQRLLKVEGEVVGVPEGDGGTACQILNEDREDVTLGQNVVRQEGRFSLRVAGPGSYTVDCRFFGEIATPYRGQQRVQIATSVTGLRISLAPMGELPISYTLENVAPDGPGYRDAGVAPTLTLRRVGSGESYSSQQPPVKVGASPKPAFQQVEPGTYWLELNNYGNYYLASATFRGRDALREPVTIEPGQGGRFDVVLRDDAAHVAIKLEAGGAEGMQAILAVDELRAVPPRVLPYGAGLGEAVLAPGRYTLFGFNPQLLNSVEYANPKVLEKYSGQTVTVSAGEHKSVVLNLNQEER